MNIRSHLYDSETWQSEILEDAPLAVSGIRALYVLELLILSAL